MSVEGISYDSDFESILMNKIQATNNAGGSRLDTRENNSDFFSHYAMNNVENTSEYTAHTATSPHDTVHLSDQALHYCEERKHK